MSGTDNFRQTEIAYLQEQSANVLSCLEQVEKERNDALQIVKEWEQKEAQLTEETKHLNEQVRQLETNLAKDKNESGAKEQHIKVLSDQNKNLLSLLDDQENAVKAEKDKTKWLVTEIARLKPAEEDMDRIKRETEEAVEKARNDTVKLTEEFRASKLLNEHLRSDIAALQAQSRVDIEALEQASAVVKKKTEEYAEVLEKQKVSERDLEEERAGLAEDLRCLTRDKAQLQIQLKGDDSDRMEFERNKGGLQTKVDTLQAQVEALKKAVSNADRSNEQIQLEHHSSAAKFREMADKVYSLMDTLRLNQVDLKKRETQNKGQDKKLAAMEKHVNNVNAKLTMEKDATDIAAEETQRAEKIADEKRRQTRKTEEQITSIQKQQEKLERDAQEMAEKVAILQQQNTHFSNKVDGQEEDKNSLKIELQSVAEKCTAIQKTNAEIAEEVESQQAVLQVCKETYNKLQGELTYMKREDLLDENGRKRPILIQANDSNLLERLRINEFLYEAQQQRNPVPMLVEKVAVLLELIHTAQSQADQYLADLSKSNGLAIALRQKNVALFESVSMFEAFKTQALIKFIRNFFEAGHCSHLRLDGLYVTEHEVMDLMAIATEYQATEKVQSVNLADCGFLDENAGCLINLLFGLPYLKEFDLSKNCFSLEAIRRFEQQCRTMEGVTNVMRSAEQIISVHSGNQLRLTINMSDQQSPDTRPADPMLDMVKEDMNHKPADDFLGTAAGKVAGGFVPKSQANFGQLSSGMPLDAKASVPVGLGGPGDVDLKKGSRKTASKNIREAPAPPIMKASTPPILKNRQK